MTFGFFRARILTHFRAAALGFEPKLPGSLAVLSFTGRMGTTLGDQWVPPERLRRGLFDHSRDQASSPAGLATTLSGSFS
jgi:hypothetical protein